MANLSLENILYQGKHNKLANGLIAIFENAIEKNANQDFKAARDSLEEITPLVKSITGINLSVKVVAASEFSKAFGSPYRAEIEMPKDFTYQSIINPKAVKAVSSLDETSVELLEFVNGSIDFRLGRVDGFYSKIPFVVEFTDLILDGNMGPDELATIILHELGHAWTLLITIGMGSATAALTFAIDDYFNRHQEPEKRLAFVKAKLKKKPVHVKGDESKEDFINLLVGDAIIRSSETYGFDFKSVEVAEYLSDQFANRWGMGASLVKALKSLNNLNGFMARFGITSPWRGVIDDVFTITTSAALGVVHKAKILTAGIFIKATIAQLVTGVIVNGLLNIIQPNGRHPSLRDRILAIRRDNVALLQNPNINKAEKANILKDIDAIDELNKDIGYYEGVFATSALRASGLLTGRTQAENHKESIRARTNNGLHELHARIEATK